MVARAGGSSTAAAMAGTESTTGKAGSVGGGQERDTASTTTRPKTSDGGGGVNQDASNVMPDLMTSSSSLPSFPPVTPSASTSSSPSDALRYAIDTRIRWFVLVFLFSNMFSIANRFYELISQHQEEIFWLYVLHALFQAGQVSEWMDVKVLNGFGRD